MKDDEKIVWYCGADGSWGGCERSDLIIVPLSELTEAESLELMVSDDSEVIAGVIMDADQRIANRTALNMIAAARAARERAEGPEVAS